MSEPALTHGLRVAREAAALTQDDLSAKLGVTRAAVSQWEVGASVPGGPARRLLAQLFDVPLEVVDGWFAQPKTGEEAA